MRKRIGYELYIHTPANGNNDIYIFKFCSINPHSPYAHTHSLQYAHK